MDDKTKGTMRDDGSITPSGVTPSSAGTQKDTQPVIPSGIAPGTPPSQIISSGVSSPGSEIVLNDENYKILKVIAKSTGEAEVYLAEKENQKYVFKYYYPNFKPKDSLLKKLIGLHHDDTVDLLDYGYYNDRFFEILEYAEGGSLADIQEDGKYKYIPIKDINRIRQIVKETVNALHWCHTKGIIHRDVKPENIFFKNPDGTDVLIGDFGISSILDEGLSKHMTGQARTEIYAAPELYQSIGGKTMISKEVDYYSLGISLIFVWQAKDPFEELHPHAIMRIKLEGKVYIPEDIPEELKNLIKGLLTVEPSKRWGYEEVQKWLKGEHVPVYYKVVETKYPDFHFGVIGGEDIVINNPEELAKLLEKYPEQGKKHLYKGTIQRWVENVDQSLYVEIRGIVEDDYPQDHNAGLVKAVYILDPMKNYKTFAGVECRTAEEIGDALERESSYYKSLLTQKKNADLFLFLEARGSKSVADTFRKYAQAFSTNPERAFNTMVLELQGKDKFKIDNLVFYKPEDLLSADDNIKDKLVNLLLGPDSKLSVWLEQFPHLKSNIDKWRNSGRPNIITLAYALDEKSPFTALDEKVYNLDEFKTFFAKHITDKDLISEMTTSNSVFVVEADFWLENYQSTNCKEVVGDFFEKYVSNPKADKEISRNLIEYIIEAEPDIEYYWNDIKPSVEKGYKNKIVSDATYKKHIEYIVVQYTKKNVDLDYYLSEVKPLTAFGDKKGLISIQVKEIEKNYLLKKYEEAISTTSDHKKYINILNKIKSIDHSYKLLKEYKIALRKKYFKYFAIIVAVSLLSYCALIVIREVNRSIQEENRFMAQEERMGQLLFADDFNNNKNNWPVSDNFNIGIKNGVYSIYLNQPIKKLGFRGEVLKSLERWEPIKEIKPDEFFGIGLRYDGKKDFSSFIMEAKVTKVRGDSNAYFGLEFFGGDVPKAHVFMVNANGYYKVAEVMTQGEERVIMSNDGKQHLWAMRVKNLTSGYNDTITTTNFLKVVCNEDKVMVYCNNKLLKSIRVKNYPSYGGEIGFIVGHDVHVQFSDLKLYSISN